MFSASPKVCAGVSGWLFPTVCPKAMWGGRFQIAEGSLSLQKKAWYNPVAGSLGFDQFQLEIRCKLSTYEGLLTTGTTCIWDVVDSPSLGVFKCIAQRYIVLQQQFIAPVAGINAEILYRRSDQRITVVPAGLNIWIRMLTSLGTQGGCAPEVCYWDNLSFVEHTLQIFVLSWGKVKMYFKHNIALGMSCSVYVVLYIVTSFDLNGYPIFGILEVVFHQEKKLMIMLGIFFLQSCLLTRVLFPWTL